MHLENWFGKLHIYPHCTCYRVIAQSTYSITIHPYPHSTSSANTKHLYTHQHSGLPQSPLDCSLLVKSQCSSHSTLINYCYNIEHKHTVQLDDFKCATETRSYVFTLHTLFITSPPRLQYSYSFISLNKYLKVPHQTDFTYIQLFGNLMVSIESNNIHSCWKSTRVKIISAH